MTRSALKFQGPEQIFRVTLEQWEQEVPSIPEWGTSEGAGCNFFGVVISKKGLLAPVYIMDYTFLKLLDTFSS